MNIAIGYIKRVSSDGTHSRPQCLKADPAPQEHLIIYLGITDIWAPQMTSKEFAARARSGHIESSLRA
jgi:hypothetical protein